MSSTPLNHIYEALLRSNSMSTSSQNRSPNPTTPNPTPTTTPEISSSIDSYTHPLILHNNDQSGMVLISKKLISFENYASWKRSFRQPRTNW